MHKRHLTASALLASALVLTACGSSTSGNDAAGPTTSSSTAAVAVSNKADIGFLTGMKPHHEQAVEMSEMILAANPPAEVAAIAQKIKSAQDPEIGQMTMMLGDLGMKADGKVHSGGHSAGQTGHGGMMNDADMEALMKATGTQAARLYLEGMVKHHQGAIEASDAEISDGKYGPALALAKEIKTAQAAEIITMQALLKTL